MNEHPNEFDVIELGDRVAREIPAPKIPKPESESGPRNRRPKHRTLRAIVAGVAGLLVLIPTAAFASPGHDGTHVGSTHADEIACWIPTPQGPAVGANVSPEATQAYWAWAAENMHQRTRDGVWEVLVRTDLYTLPSCVQVLPGVWVYAPDAPAVQAYLANLNARKS